VRNFVWSFLRFCVLYISSQNDLDLDLFCREVIQADLHTLTITPFPNAPTGSHHADYEINEASTVVDVSLGRHHG
jgi:ion channel-forming bestrophin family protein